MADPGDRVTRAYRELAREAPPPALDAAILAASREAVRPRVRNRWAGPVSIAAVLVLGIGISLRMQLEQPGIETSVPNPPTPVERAEHPRVAQAPAEARAKSLPADARAKDSPAEERARLPERNTAAAPLPSLQPQPPPPPPPQPKLLRNQAPMPEAPAKEQQAPPPEALAKSRTDERVAESAPIPAPSMAAPAAPAAAASAESPAPQRAKREAAGALARDSAAKPDADERVAELERIARLRADGRHVEADKALEEFRRRNPDYRIPEAMWERVRPR